MANEYISPLQKYTPSDFKGLITQRHLAQMYMIEPYLMSKAIKPLYYVNENADAWMGFLNQFPEVEVPTERSLEWMLIGRSEKNIPLICASLSKAGAAISANDQCGKNKGRFWMQFPEAYFDADHVIVGMNPDDYAIRITSPAEMIGSNAWYEVELVANNLNLFVPYEDLAASTRWSIDYTLTETTLSKRGTGMSHTSPFRMAVEMSFMRKEYTVPGVMIDEGKNNPLAFDFVNNKGKTITGWINKADYDFKVQFEREIARLLLYGRPNKLEDGTYYNTGESGYQIKAGPGLRNQISSANILKAPAFSLNLLLEFLRGLSYGKLPEDKRKFAIITGEYGFADFTAEIEAIPGVTTHKQYAYGMGLGDKIYEGAIQKLSYKTPQYIKYCDIQGIEIYLMHNPMYDDFIRNKKMHPTEAGTLESRRMTILDFGTEQGESNIVRLRPSGRPNEIWKYIPGFRDPFSPGGTKINPSMAVTEVDGYKVMCSWEGGIAIKNPMRCGEFIINSI